MITENQALKIAKEVGYPTFDGASPVTEFTRALNLAAAMALAEAAKNVDDYVIEMHLKYKANECRQAVKAEMK